MTILLKALKYAGDMEAVAEKLRAVGHDVITVEIPQRMDGHAASIYDVHAELIQDTACAAAVAQEPQEPRMPVGMGVIGACVLFAGGFVGGLGVLWMHDSKTATPEQMERANQLAVIRGQQVSAETQAQAQVSFQKRIADLQLAVTKTCVEQKGTPEFINNNVVCRK